LKLLNKVQSFANNKLNQLVKELQDKNDILVKELKESTIQSNISLQDKIDILEKEIKDKENHYIQSNKSLNENNIKIFSELKELENKYIQVKNINFANELDLKISTEVKKSIKIWDISNVCNCYCLNGHRSIVNSVAILNNTIISDNDDKSIKIWDISNGNCIKTLEGHSK
jgi:WD40 repeat protein